jgi:type VI secretion system secreted protein VgrG
MPPWELPANATQSGYLTRSSKGGAPGPGLKDGPGDANAIRFEDKKGAEQLWIHAQLNQLTEVEFDEDKWVGNDRRKTIDGNETNTIHKNRTETVDLNESVTITGNRTAFVGDSETTRVKDNRTHVVKVDLADQVGQNKSTLVGKSFSIEAGESFTITCGDTIFAMHKSGSVSITCNTFNFTAKEAAQINAAPLHLNPDGGKADIEPAPQGGDAIKAAVDAQFPQESKSAAAAPAAAGAGAAPVVPEQTAILPPAPPAPEGPAAVDTGLGADVNALAAKSPTLQKDLAELEAKGWEVEWGGAGTVGSTANRTSKPPKIVLDPALKSDPKTATQVLAHEVGHAKYPYKADYSSKTAYVDGTLKDEGAATIKNIQVQREIISNTGGKTDIGIAGNSANHKEYNAAYDQYLKDGNADAARSRIAKQFETGETTSTDGKTYGDYYGDWYDTNFPKK